MKRIYNHLMKYKLYTRLMLSFSTMIIVSIVIIGCISYISSYRIAEDLASSFSKKSVESVGVNLNHIFNEAERLADQVENNSLFQNILNEEMPDEVKKRYSTELEYDFKLYELARYTTNIFDSLYVLGNNGYNFKSHNVRFQDRDFREEEWYKRILEAEGFVWFKPREYSRVSRSINNTYITLGYPVINKANGKRIGVVLVELDVSRIEHVLKEYGNIQNGVVQVLDRDNTVLFQQGQEITEGKMKISNEKKERNSLFYQEETLVNGWIVKSYISKRIILGGMIRLGILLLVVIVLLILIMVKLTSVISGTVTKPIGRLIELMKEAEYHEFDVQMNVKYKDELSVLGTQFNDMMEFTRHLIAVNNKEQENLREAELKTLQMQINPHFLYNTLETVIWLIRTDDKKTALSVIISLTKFFRIGLSRGKNIITLREELEHVKQYINIQNTRYREKIEFWIELDDTLLDIKMPKLVLQPLVENAIYHGIQEKDGKGTIRISVRREENKSVRIAIEDNGVGMTGVQTQRLMMGLEGTEDIGFGLYNTNQRLKKYFGDSVALRIRSEFGAGTTVDFLIPVKKEEVERYD